MANVKILTGERVGLRAPRLQDADELFASVASDPEVTRYMSWTPHLDVDETRRVITELFNVGDERTWLIELRATGEIIDIEKKMSAEFEKRGKTVVRVDRKPFRDATMKLHNGPDATWPRDVYDKLQAL